MGVVINFILNIILTVLLSLFKNTKYYDSIEQWKANVHINKRLHSKKEINEKVSKLNYDIIGRTKQLNGRILRKWYEADMRKMIILDNNGDGRDVMIPYLEIINFIKNPQTKITISCSEEDPLFLNKHFSHPDNIKSSTERCIKEVIKINPKTTNDPHPRLAKLVRISENEYQCVLEETDYYTQIKFVNGFRHLLRWTMYYYAYS